VSVDDVCDLVSPQFGEPNCCSGRRFSYYPDLGNVLCLSPSLTLSSRRNFIIKLIQVLRGRDKVQVEFRYQTDKQGGTAKVKLFKLVPVLRRCY